MRLSSNSEPQSASIPTPTGSCRLPWYLPQARRLTSLLADAWVTSRSTLRFVAWSATATVVRGCGSPESTARRPPSGSTQASRWSRSTPVTRCHHIVAVADSVLSPCRHHQMRSPAVTTSSDLSRSRPSCTDGAHSCSERTLSHAERGFPSPRLGNCYLDGLGTEQCTFGLTPT